MPDLNNNNGKVHPTGRYRHNSVIHILSRERGLSNLAGFGAFSFNLDLLNLVGY
jgi:hypothetical protein